MNWIPFDRERPKEEPNRYVAVRFRNTPKLECYATSTVNRWPDDVTDWAEIDPTVALDKAIPESLITLVEINPSLFRVNFARNGVKLGEIYKEVDGFFGFTTNSGGFWAAHILRAIADQLDVMNEPWVKEIEKGVST